MKLVWGTRAWSDYQRWQVSEEKIFRSINELINDIRKTPFEGLGKPEPLKYELKGWWSRRITAEHRLVYRVSGKGADQKLEIAQCRYHYK